MISAFAPALPPLSRRTFLRGIGAAMALPWLDAMQSGARAASPGKSQPPRRMIAIETNMGILPQFFFPENAGRGYKPSPYLENLRDFADDFTVFTGVSHPGVTGGHAADKVF
jgi:hypothetical protein